MSNILKLYAKSKKKMVQTLANFRKLFPNGYMSPQTDYVEHAFLLISLKLAGIR